MDTVKFLHHYHTQDQLLGHTTVLTARSKTRSGFLSKSLKPNSEVFQLRAFYFALYWKRKTRRWKPWNFLWGLSEHNHFLKFNCGKRALTNMILWPSLFWSHKPVLMHLDQTLSFSNQKHGDGKLEVWTNSLRENSEVFIFEFSILSVVQNGKLGSWKTSEFDQSTSEFDQNASEKISEVYISGFSVLGIAQNGKLRVKKPRKNILRDFRELRVSDLTLYLLDIKCVTVVYTWCTQSENETWVYCQSRQCRRKLHQKYEMKSHILLAMCIIMLYSNIYSDSETKFHKNWLLWYLKHQINYCTSLYSEGCKVVCL